MAFLCLLAVGLQAHPVKELIERIDKGASSGFVIEEVASDTDFFELDMKGRKVVIRGNNSVSIAAGLNWYLKYYAGIHLSWNGMKAKLPAVLPAVKERVRHSTDMRHRYYLNYCTHSYSMAFWDWERWEQEIDWMALHGVNMPLQIVGTDAVWRNVLLRLGYTEEEAGEFIAGPGFQAWWLMNNLEGWGGPNTENWYSARLELARKINARMKEFGIEPVYPGYSGMLPHDASEHLGLDVSDPGFWNGYHRPAFLLPGSDNFDRIAAIYYEEQAKLLGTARFYSMDPFHEGGNTAGVNLADAGRAIMAAMKKASPEAVWVVQAWGGCPYDAMIKDLQQGDMIVLDLYSESRPQWGDPDSSWYRKNGFLQHEWLYCMLLNFGGNVGLHGKIGTVIDAFYKAKDGVAGKTLTGTGMTMEGIGNNPVMYELLSELPWRSEHFPKAEWLDGYVRARYGRADVNVAEAWSLLEKSIYNCPPYSLQQGTHESIFCARPSDGAYQVSKWSSMQDYYSPDDVIAAAGKMLEAAGAFRGNNNFEYDLVDIVRQAVAERGRQVYKEVIQAYNENDRDGVRLASESFLNLILLQDRLLASRPEFMAGTWIKTARELGASAEEKDWLEWNARVQVTTWGNRTASETGGLRDYAHKEWSGMLKDVYYPRWKKYFETLLARMDGKACDEIDYYAMDEAWTLSHNPYPYLADGNPVDVARDVYDKLF